jgi:hypothetical protein
VLAESSPTTTFLSTVGLQIDLWKTLPEIACRRRRETAVCVVEGSSTNDIILMVLLSKGLLDRFFQATGSSTCRESWFAQSDSNVLRLSSLIRPSQGVRLRGRNRNGSKVGSIMWASGQSPNNVVNNALGDHSFLREGPTVVRREILAEMDSNNPFLGSRLGHFLSDTVWLQRNSVWDRLMTTSFNFVSSPHQEEKASVTTRIPRIPLESSSQL